VHSTVPHAGCTMHTACRLGLLVLFAAMYTCVCRW
jgi:hypothetical protein